MFNKSILFIVFFTLTSNYILSRPGGGSSYRSSSSSSSSSSRSSSSSTYKSTYSNSSSSSSSSKSYGSSSSKETKYKDIPATSISENFTIQSRNTTIELMKDGSAKITDDYTILVPDKPYLKLTLPCKDPDLPYFTMEPENITINKWSFDLVDKVEICKFKPNSPSGSKEIVISSNRFSLFSNSISNLKIEYEFPYFTRSEKSTEEAYYEINKFISSDQSLQFFKLNIVYPLEFQTPKFIFFKDSNKSQEIYFESKQDKNNISLEVNNYQFDKPVLMGIIFPKNSFSFKPFPIDGYKNLIYKNLNIQAKLKENSILEVTENIEYENVLNEQIYASRGYPSHIYKIRKELEKPHYFLHYSFKIDPETYYFSEFQSSGAYYYTFYLPTPTTKIEKTRITYNLAHSLINENGKTTLVFPLNLEYSHLTKISFSLSLPFSLDPNKTNVEIDYSNHRSIIKTKEQDKSIFIEIDRINIEPSGYLNLLITFPNEINTNPGLDLKFIWFIIKQYREYGIALYLIPFLILLLPILTIGLIKYYNKIKQNKLLIQKKKEEEITSALDKNFSIPDFKEKVSETYLHLNDAWLKQNMKPARKFISSGLYNRFRVQLSLMKQNNIINIMKQEKILNIQIVQFENGNVYESLHVQLIAEAKDCNVSTSLSSEDQTKLLNNQPLNSYTEIWSFIRKKNLQTKKGFGLTLGNCPSCGAPAEISSDSIQCPYCKSLFNSGEHDWVLSEITQEVEWNTNEKIPDGWTELIKINFELSKQNIEDRASYIFWKWIESRVSNSLSNIRRECTPLFLANPIIQENLKEVAVGSVDLENCRLDGERILVELLIKWSGADSKNLEPIHRKNTFTLVLENKKNKTVPFAGHTCISCGSPLPETDASNCEYCNSLIPEKINDWLLESIN
jgi:DNA-directed RNA polymerase subunit RPC12/RpoP